MCEIHFNRIKLWKEPEAGAEIFRELMSESSANRAKKGEGKIARIQVD